MPSASALISFDSQTRRDMGGRNASVEDSPANASVLTARHSKGLSSVFLREQNSCHAAVGLSDNPEPFSAG